MAKGGIRGCARRALRKLFGSRAEDEARAARDQRARTRPARRARPRPEVKAEVAAAAAVDVAAGELGRLPLAPTRPTPKDSQLGGRIAQAEAAPAADPAPAPAAPPPASPSIGLAQADCVLFAGRRWPWDERADIMDAYDLDGLREAGSPQRLSRADALGQSPASAQPALPPGTLLPNGLTDPQYSRGSRLVFEVEGPSEDMTHMNPEFGRLQLREMLARLDLLAPAPAH